MIAQQPKTKYLRLTLTADGRSRCCRPFGRSAASDSNSNTPRPREHFGVRKGLRSANEFMAAHERVAPVVSPSLDTPRRERQTHTAGRAAPPSSAGQSRSMPRPHRAAPRALPGGAAEAMHSINCRRKNAEAAPAAKRISAFAARESLAVGGGALVGKRGNAGKLRETRRAPRRARPRCGRAI